MMERVGEAVRRTCSGMRMRNCRRFRAAYSSRAAGFKRLLGNAASEKRRSIEIGLLNRNVQLVTLNYALNQVTKPDRRGRSHVDLLDQFREFDRQPFARIRWLLSKIDRAFASKGGWRWIKVERA